MKTITSLNESVAVILHCELRLEPHAAAERLAESKAIKRKSKVAPDTEPDTVSPSFACFAETWFDDNVVRWKHSYKLTLRASLDKHILPAFGERAVNEISRSDILSFRAGIARQPGRGDASTLSPARINTVMVPLRLILNEAADRFDFESPYVRVKALKVPRSCITPFTLDEVNAIISKARDDFKPYFKIRFFTGMRTGEIHGLKWKYVNFKRREIQIRESFVAGEFTDTKTDSSCRDIPMSDIVYDAFRNQEQRSGSTELVFCTRGGNPLGVQNISNRVWKPLLQSLNLPYRRLYHTRHTAASLWLASGENVLWVSQLLGHSDPNTTLRKYAKYAPNLTRKDGSAFAALLAERNRP